MEFIDPSLEEVYQTLLGNDKIINFLKENNLLITKKELYKDFTREMVESMSASIYAANVSTLYDVAQVLLNYKTKIKENQIWYLLSNKIAWDELAYALGISAASLSADIYREIMFCFKYCSVSSFFQNNKDKFMPESDYYMLEENDVGMAYYDAVMKEFDKLDCVISKCIEYTDYDKIPWDLINYLTQLLGFEKSTINADEEGELKYRELAKNILDIYRIKGTNYSFELFFNFLGFNIKIEEYYFDRRLYYTTNTAGNNETEASNNMEYEYYLTTEKPTDNKLKNVGVNEIVLPSDISPQYSMNEFNVLCQEYGPAAVLGYSPVYNVYNSLGEVIETKEYTGKVYKYFKTNVIYYKVGLDKRNPNKNELKAFTKYLEFLTPTYVMRDIKIDVYDEKNEEKVSFDGDGKGNKETDEFGNFKGEFEMLDSEDWSQDFKDEYTVGGGLNGGLKRTKEGEYKGRDETFETYQNSLGGKEFRLPIGYSLVSKSVSKYLTNSTGGTKPQYRRLKYYIIHELNGETSGFSWDTENVVVYPYYTVPPFTGETHYKFIETKWDEPTKQVNLIGGDGEGGEDCVKNQVKLANSRKPVEFVTDLTIDEFASTSEEFNELVPEPIMNRNTVELTTVKYGPKEVYKNAFECYQKEFSGYHICNAINDKTKFENGLVKKEIITNYYRYPEVYKQFTYGDYMLAYTGTLQSGSLVLYRFGNYELPNALNTDRYLSAYSSYVRSFNYVLKKDYNGSLLPDNSANKNVAISSQFLTKASLKSAQEHVDGKRAKMIELLEEYPTSPDKWKDIDYVTETLYYITSDKNYYRAVKVPVPTISCNIRYASGQTHMFETYEDATKYFEQYSEEKFCNTEFYVKKENQLYSFKYKNRRKGTLIYSTKDEMLYVVNGNSAYDLVPYPNFCGRLTITDYIRDDAGDYIIRDGLMDSYVYDQNAERYSEYKSQSVLPAAESHLQIIRMAEINDYDQYWFGYDEQADEEDFIFYNSNHKVTWENAGLYNAIITRPVKSSTDCNFEEDLSKIDKVYDKEKDDLSEFTNENGYYKTLAQKLIAEICNKTIDCFTSNENINWGYNYYSLPESILKTISPVEYELYEAIDDLESEDIDEFKNYKVSKDKEIVPGKKYFTKSRIGLLSIIEDNMEKITGATHDKGFDYYSKVSDFIQDYYRMIYMGNMNENSIPKNILEDVGKLTATNKKKIQKYYNIAIMQIGCIIDSIAHDRVYYSFIGNWRKMTAGQVALGNLGNWTEDYYDDPLNCNPFYDDKKHELIVNNEKHYPFTQKTNFLLKILNIKKDLINKYTIKENGNIKQKIIFDFPIDSKTGKNELLGKDAYSLNGTIDYNNYNYYYMDYTKSKKNAQRITFNNLSLTKDSNGDWYIPYRLDYGLTQYSKDYYGEQREIYSEFTELLDLFIAHLNNEDSVNTFLKSYYYNNLVKYYREAPIEDREPLGLDIYGKRPMLAYPKLTELLDGKAGTFGNPSTLLSSYKNNGGKNDTDIRLRFSKFNMTVDNNRVATLEFYTNRKDFYKAFGYDFNRWYKKMDLFKVTNSDIRQLLSNEIENLFSKQFTCIKPSFYYYDERPSFYSNNLTTWQKLKNKFQKDYKTAKAELFDANYNPITDINGNVLDANGKSISETKPTSIRDRLSEGEIIKITIVDSDALSQYFETYNLNGKPISTLTRLFENKLESENIYGILSIKHLKQRLIDNYISYPKSLDWIEKDENNIPSEYTSFGDDRSLTIDVINTKSIEENISEYVHYKQEVVDNEEYIQTTKTGYMLDENGKEIINYNKTQLLEDQGIKPKYVSKANKKYNERGDIKYQSKINGVLLPFFDASVYTNQFGKLILRINNFLTRVSNIVKIKLIYSLKYLYVFAKKKSVFSFLNTSIYFANYFKNIINDIVYNIKLPTLRVANFITNVYLNNEFIIGKTYNFSAKYAGKFNFTFIKENFSKIAVMVYTKVKKGQIIRSVLSKGVKFAGKYFSSKTINNFIIKHAKVYTGRILKSQNNIFNIIIEKAKNFAGIGTKSIIFVDNIINKQLAGVGKFTKNTDDLNSILSKIRYVKFTSFIHLVVLQLIRAMKVVYYGPYYNTWHEKFVADVFATSNPDNVSKDDIINALINKKKYRYLEFITDNGDIIPKFCTSKYSSNSSNINDRFVFFEEVYEYNTVVDPDGNVINELVTDEYGRPMTKRSFKHVEIPTQRKMKEYSNYSLTINGSKVTIEYKEYEMYFRDILKKMLFGGSYTKHTGYQYITSEGINFNGLFFKDNYNEEIAFNNLTIIGQKLKEFFANIYYSCTGSVKTATQINTANNIKYLKSDFNIGSVKAAIQTNSNSFVSEIIKHNI